MDWIKILDFWRHGKSLAFDDIWNLQWEWGETSCSADPPQCELSRQRWQEVDTLASGSWLQSDQDCSATAHPWCWCSRQGQGGIGAPAQCLQLWTLWGQKNVKIKKMTMIHDIRHPWKNKDKKNNVKEQQQNAHINDNDSSKTINRRWCNNNYKVSLTIFPGDGIADHSWSQCERNGPVAVHPTAWSS